MVLMCGSRPRKANLKNGGSRVLILILYADQVKVTGNFREHLQTPGASKHNNLH
jgi:hypothetical protein